MALKPCKECKKEISTEAKVCPNCGKKNPTSSGIPVFVWLVGALVVVIALANSGDSTPAVPAVPKTPAQIAREDTLRQVQLKQKAIDRQLFGAELLCHNAAMKALKAPSTAEFQDDETYRKDLGKGRSHVQLQVDAENAFGAKIRTTVDCKTREQQNGDVLLTAFNSWTR